MAKIFTIEEGKNPTTEDHKIRQWLKSYFLKWAGQHKSTPSRTIIFFETMLTFVGSFISVAAIAAIHYRLLDRHDLVFLIGSIGASAVLLIGAPASPLGQPRNVIGGQLIGAITGCILRVLFDPDGEIFVAAALAVSLSILIMDLTDTMHPPGGATALIAIMTKKTFPWNGFQYILMPTMSGTLIMLFLSIIINNLSSRRYYPSAWF